MKRSLLQVYVKGSVDAVAFYQMVFDTKVTNEHKNSNGQYIHAELDICGQILAVSEKARRKHGNNMQFCIQFNEDERAKLVKAFKTLKEGAIKIEHNCKPCFYSPLMASLIDKYGIYWCLFV